MPCIISFTHSMSIFKIELSLFKRRCNHLSSMGIKSCNWVATDTYTFYKRELPYACDIKMIWAVGMGENLNFDTWVAFSTE